MRVFVFRPRLDAERTARTIADHGNVLTILQTQFACRHRHTQGSGNTGGRVPRAEGVILGFRAFRKAGNPIQLTQMSHLLTSSGDDFVTVTLMTDIPDDFVIRRVEHMVQRDGQLNRTQIGRQMPAGLCDRLQDKITQFF